LQICAGKGEKNTPRDFPVNSQRVSSFSIQGKEIEIPAAEGHID